MDKQNLKSLLEKIKLAEEVYTRAASKIHSDKMSTDLINMTESLGQLRSQLMKENNLSIEDIHLSIQDRLTVSLEKFGMEVDDIIIRMNQKEALAYCENRESEIMTGLKTLINSKNLSEEEKERFQDLKSDSEKRSDYFKKIIEDYKVNYAN